VALAAAMIVRPVAVASGASPSPTSRRCNHWRGGGKIPGTARWFAGLGLRYGTLQAWLSVVTEIGHGGPTGHLPPAPARAPRGERGSGTVRKLIRVPLVRRLSCPRTAAARLAWTLP
jgi:hypothetical protein